MTNNEKARYQSVTKKDICCGYQYQHFERCSASCNQQG